MRGPDGAFLKEKGPPIRTLTYAELQRYDLGRVDPATRYATTHPDQKAVDGTRMPRLSEVFELARRARNFDVRFNIETKISPLAPEQALPPDEFVERLLVVIYANGMQRQVTIQSFDWRTLRRVQQIAPELPTVYLSAQQKFFDNIIADKPEGSPWVAGFQAKDHGNSMPRMVKMLSPPFRSAQNIFS